MPLDKLQRKIATIALKVGRRYGLALGGAGALIEHGIVHRPTQDLDLVTNSETGVAAAAGPVQAALHDAGLSVVRRGDSLADLFPGFSETLVDLDVTAPDGQQTTVELVYFDRALNTVTSDIGPVLHIEDALAGKVCALASRAAERDYIDTAAAVARGYTPGQLIAFARRLDPGLTGQDFADAGRRLDQLSDQRWTDLGFNPAQVTQMRERFADWPRDAEAADQELPVADPEERGRQHEQLRGPAREEPAQTATPGPAREDPGQEHTLQQATQEPPGPVPVTDEREVSQDNPGQDPEAASGRLRGLTEDLQRADATLQRIQARQAERAAQEEAEDEDRRREHYRAAEQQHQEERTAEPERGAPEIEP